MCNHKMFGGSGLGIFPFLIKFIGKTKLEGFESSRFPVGVFSRKSIFPIPYASLYTFSISLPLDTFLHQIKSCNDVLLSYMLKIGFSYLC